MTEEAAIADVRALLDRRRMPFKKIVVLSRPSYGKKAARLAARVDLSDGATIKVRRLEDVEHASRLADIRRNVDAAFAPIVEQDGPFLVERWIDGAELGEAEATNRAEQMGQLLGRLHATAVPAQRTIETRERREHAIDQLHGLSAAGVITADLQQALLRDIERSDPREAAPTVVHLDYCPENLVVDRDGALHVIDNEWIRIDAAGLDLGRTYSRWAADDAAWARFLDGYARTAPASPDGLKFWLIVMAAAGATIRLGRTTASLALPVARLHQLGAMTPR
jgi:Ser/Thr protein kinase RdoA (MazF antagonist)